MTPKKFIAIDIIRLSVYCGCGGEEIAMDFYPRKPNSYKYENNKSTAFKAKNIPVSLLRKIVKNNLRKLIKEINKTSKYYNDEQEFCHRD